MTVSMFESLPVDVLFEIFGYLSPVNILQTFLYINKRLSRNILMNICGIFLLAIRQCHYQYSTIVVKIS